VTDSIVPSPLISYSRRYEPRGFHLKAISVRREGHASKMVIRARDEDEDEDEDEEGEGGRRGVVGDRPMTKSKVRVVPAETRTKRETNGEFRSGGLAIPGGGFRSRCETRGSECRPTDIGLSDLSRIYKRSDYLEVR
jgi:hypothetical protein